MSLSRDDILKADDIKTERVDVPDWAPKGTKKKDAFVFIRGLSGEERDQWEASIIETKGKNTRVNMKNARAKLISLSAVDESGELIFTPKDVIALGKKSAAMLDECFAVASRLSGISDKDVEELAVGLEENPFDDSPSD